MTPTNPALSFEIFVRVIDNHGDVGATLRLARRLGQLGHRCRIWTDDLNLLLAMSPTLPSGVTCAAWPDPSRPCPLVDGDIWIEAFGCELPHEVQLQWCAHPHRLKTTKNWINLEYFTTESYAQRCHGLPSPVLHGPAAGATKWFYYPGWTQGLGGVVPRQMLPTKSAPDATHTTTTHKRQRPWALLFCYEPKALGALCQLWQPHVHMRVAPGKPQVAWAAQCPNTQADFLPWTDQLSFDRLMAQSDFNLVRGEDSILTAMAMGKPCLWHIYPQEDGAHAAKLHAFLETLQAPPSVIRAHEVWNDLSTTKDSDIDWLPLPHTHTWEEWQEFARFCAQTLHQAPDLAEQLVDFALSGKM